MTDCRSNPVVTGPCASAGFSLIELLVAVLVIVLLTTVVSLNVGSGGADIALADEVRDLAIRMSYAQSEAEMSGADHGLLIELQGVGIDAQFVGAWRRLYDQGWSAPRAPAEVLDDIMFCDRCELVLLLEGQPEVVLEPDPDIVNPPPQIQFFAGGEVTPGALEWLDRQTRDVLWRLEWDIFGRMKLMPRGRAPDDLA